MRKNKNRPIVRNVRRVIYRRDKFMEWGNRASFPNNGKILFTEGMFNKKIEMIS